MKLYKVPRNTRIRLIEDTKAPPDIGGYAEGTELNFHHIDGMYSYCKDDEGNVYHPAAWTEVEIVEAK